MSNVVDAVKDGNFELVRTLIDQGQSIDFDPDGTGSPLHWAVMCTNTDILSYLLKHGADVNVRTKWGKTPLHVAADLGYLDCITLLLSKGAHVDASSIHGDTPLHVAAHRGFVEACRMLVRRGASISLLNQMGKTPVEVARGQGHQKVANILITQGRLEGKHHTEKLTPIPNIHQPDRRLHSTAPFLQSQFFRDQRTMRPPISEVKPDKSHVMNNHGNHILEKMTSVRSSLPSQIDEGQNLLSTVKSHPEVVVQKNASDYGGYGEKKILNIPLPSPSFQFSPTKATETGYSGVMTNAQEDVKSDKLNKFESNDEHMLNFNTSKDEIKVVVSKKVRPFSESFPSESHMPKTNPDSKESIDCSRLVKVNGSDVPKKPSVEDDLKYKIIHLIRQREMLERYIEKLQIELTKRQDKIDLLEKMNSETKAVYMQYSSLMEELNLKTAQAEESRKKADSLQQDLNASRERMAVEISRSRHLARQLFELRQKIEYNPSLFKAVTVSKIPQMTTKMPPRPTVTYREGCDSLTELNNMSAIRTGGGRFLGRGLDSPETRSPSPRPGTSQDVSGHHLNPDMLCAALGMSSQCSHENLFTALLPVLQTLGPEFLNDMTQRLQSKMKETGLVQRSRTLLDSPGRPWVMGTDYVLLDEIPWKQTSNSFQFRIIHKEQLHNLHIFPHIEFQVSTSSTSLDLSAMIPKHQNISRILHHYYGTLTSVKEHLPTSALQSSTAAAPQPADALFIITDAFPSSLKQLLQGYKDTQGAVPPFGLPERFIFQVFYELLSAVCCFEEAGLTHGGISDEMILVDQLLQVVISGAELMRGSGSENQSTVTASKTDAHCIARIMCELFSSSDIPQQVPSCFPLLLRHVLTAMLLDDPISTRDALIRIGIWLFGPKIGEIADLTQCQVWLQTKMMKLLVQAPTKPIQLPEGEVTTLEVSMELKNGWLERHFITLLTPNTLWQNYQAIKDML